MNNNIVFVSYGESNAEVNWDRLKYRFPQAIRIDGIKGIRNAYREAAIATASEYLYIVDADSLVFFDFLFDFDPTIHNFSTFVFQARNPVNGLEYGYGGIKLYKRCDLLDVTQSQVMHDLEFMSFYDFPVAKNIKFLKILASITQFNSSEFDSWKAGFRECCKLETFGNFMGLSKEQISVDMERQHIWTTIGEERNFGKWAIEGALDGKAYGKKHNGDIEKICLINDYDWLKKKFTLKYANALSKR